MKVNFYQTAYGRSPIEDFIKDLQKIDQARFAEVIIGIEDFGLGYSRVQFKPPSEENSGKLNSRHLAVDTVWHMLS